MEAVTAAVKDLYAKAFDLARSRSTEDAVDAAQAVVAECAGTPETLLLLGVLSARLGEVGKAIALVEQAHEAAPDIRDYADILASLNAQGGRLPESLYFAKLATTMSRHPWLGEVLPKVFTDYFSALGKTKPSRHLLDALIKLNDGNLEGAEAEAERELALNRDNPQGRLLLGQIKSLQGYHAQAAVHIRKAADLSPDQAEPMLRMAEVLLRLGMVDAAAECIARARTIEPGNVDAILAAIHLEGYRSDPSMATRNDLRRDLEDRLAPKVEGARGLMVRHERPATSQHRRRVGYLYGQSPDVIPFLDAMIGAHDRTRHEIFLYQTTADRGGVFERLRANADHHRSLVGVDDVSAALLLAGDELDVLVDVLGCRPGSRPAVLASHPAYVQVGWLGFPDYADAMGIDAALGGPQSTGAEWSGEPRVLWLTQGLVTLNPPAGMNAPPTPSPALRNGYVTFASMLDLSRINAFTATLWAQLLRAVPGARLRLGGIDHVADEVVVDTFALFEAEGVGERVVIATPDVAGYAFDELFAEADIYLDPSPVSGGREVALALWMGLPVVTLAGAQWPARWGANMLASAGRAEWVAASPGDYVERGAALAADPAKLAALRAGLRDEVKQSALLRPEILCREFEMALAALVERARASAVG